MWATPTELKGQDRSRRSRHNCASWVPLAKSLTLLHILSCSKCFAVQLIFYFRFLLLNRITSSMHQHRWHTTWGWACGWKQQRQSDFSRASGTGSTCTRASATSWSSSSSSVTAAPSTALARTTPASSASLAFTSTSPLRPLHIKCYVSPACGSALAYIRC